MAIFELQKFYGWKFLASKGILEGNQFIAKEEILSIPKRLLIFVTFALFVDGFIYGQIIPLTPHALAHITEEWMLGSMYSGYSVGAIVSTLFYGILVREHGHRRLLLIGAGLQLFSTVLFTFAPHYFLLLLARTLQGAAASIIWTGGLALIAEYYPQERAKMMGMAMMGGTLGLIAGPIIGGYLFEWYNFVFSMMAAVIFSILDIIMRFIFIPIQRPLSPNTENTLASSLLSQLRELRLLLQDRRVLAANFVTIIGAWCWCVIEALLPHHLEVTTGATAAQVGTLFTVSSLIYALVCPIVGGISDRRGPWKTIAIGFLGMGLVMPFVPRPQILWGASILLILVDIFYAFMMDPPLSELGAVAALDPHHKSAYTSVFVTYNISYSLGMIGSGIVSGAVAELFSLQTTLLVTGLLMLLLFTFALIKIKTKSKVHRDIFSQC